MTKNPCRKCAFAYERDGGKQKSYSYACGKCEAIKKHEAYLESKRKYTIGEPITSFDELLSQEFVMFHGKPKHIGFIKSMQLRTVENSINRGGFHKAIKIERED